MRDPSTFKRSQYPNAQRRTLPLPRFLALQRFNASVTCRKALIDTPSGPRGMDPAELRLRRMPGSGVAAAIRLPLSPSGRGEDTVHGLRKCTWFVHRLVEFIVVVAASPVAILAVRIARSEERR